MLRLTKLTDYGILLMSHLASSSLPVHTAAGLAEATKVPLPTVSKILQMLLHDGLLESLRGANGGYRLSRAPQQISVREIVHTLEGRIALTDCNLDDCACSQQGSCVAAANWQRINDAITQVLENITLAEMAEPGFVPLFRMEKVRTIPLRVVQAT